MLIIFKVRFLYTDKVMDHFMCPRNAGSMPDADAEGVVGDQ